MAAFVAKQMVGNKLNAVKGKRKFPIDYCRYLCFHISVLNWSVNKHKLVLEDDSHFLFQTYIKTQLNQSMSLELC